jgi:CRP/FNR family transcriptional regulator, cyclic AMP receptor protein
MIAASMLASLDLFRDLSRAAVERLAPSVSTRVFDPNAHLMAVDQGSDAVYSILSGTVKVHVDEADGSEVLLAILGPGELLGEVSLLDGRKPSATVTALDRTECLSMDFMVFREAIREVPLLAFNFARILAARLRLTNAQIQSLATLNVENRVARQVMAFAERYGEPQTGGAIHIPIRLTQSDLSHIIGASREQTNRVLVSYRTRGFLSIDTNLRITILKPELLSRLAMVR